MSELKKQELPNPLEIEFGTGRIGIRQYTDDDGKFGVIFKDHFSTHEIGSKEGEPEVGHKPKEGEVYLSFANKDSLNVLIEELSECGGLSRQPQVEVKELVAALERIQKIESWKITDGKDTSYWIATGAIERHKEATSEKA